MPVPPRALAALQAEMDQITLEEHRRAAEQIGRLWLFDLVRRCADAMSAPETWDGGTRVLAAEDQRFIVELVAASKGSAGGSTGAWFACEIPESRKFRLVEAAYRCGIVKRDDFRKAVDNAVKRILAEAAGSSLQQSERTAVGQLAERCAAHVMGNAGGAAPSWRMLEAFRRLDSRELVAAASTSSVSFPHRGRRTSLVGVRGAALWAIALGLLLVPTGYALLASPPGKAGLGVRSAPVGAAERPGVYSLKDNGWKSLGGNCHVLEVSAEAFNKLMPTAAVAKDQSPLAISGMQAMEFIKRLESDVKSYREPEIERVDGTKLQKVPVSTVMWRLPTVEESAKFAPRAGAWTAGDSMLNNPFTKKPLLVIAEFKDGNGRK